MNIQVWFVLVLTAFLSSACAAMPTPISAAVGTSTPLPIASPIALLKSTTPTLSPTAFPTATTTPGLPMLPAMVGDNYAPPFVPACIGIQSLDQPFKMPWDKWDPAKLDRVIKHSLWNNWTYYRCAQSVTATAAFYRQWMPTPPYNWFEDSFEEQPEGTLAIYNDSRVSAIAGYRWVYLMFIPDASNTRNSLMATTWWNAPYTC